MPLPEIPSGLQAIIKKINKKPHCTGLPPQLVYRKRSSITFRGRTAIKITRNSHFGGSNPASWWFSLKVAQHRWKTADLATLLLYQLGID